VRILLFIIILDAPVLMIEVMVVIDVSQCYNNTTHDDDDDDEEEEEGRKTQG